MEFSLEAAIESLIFVSPKPVSINQLFKVLEEIYQGLASQSDEKVNDESEPSEESVAVVEEENVAEIEASAEPESEEILEQLGQAEEKLENVFSKLDVRETLVKIQVRYNENSDSGLNLVEVAGAFQFRTKASLQTIIKSLFKPNPSKLSKPALETLSIVAYRQPLTRVDVDSIRGVDGGGVIKTLLEKEFIKIVGRKDDVGKPVLYGTTAKFLEVFGLNSLKDLTPLRDIEEIEKEFRQQAAEAGTVLEQEPEEEDSEDFDLRLMELEEEEQEDINELESKLKDLRSLEKEVFPPEPTKVDSEEAVIPNLAIEQEGSGPTSG